MKDAFKVKKGLNVQPTDPADVVNPEAGDIIVDSTDDNRLKVYDPTSSEFAAVGTGGSSGNILADIEKLTPTVSNVVAVTDTTVFLPIDDNNKSVKATFSGSDGTIRYEAPASADLDGVQGVVKVWIKTSLTNLSLVATKDGVAQNNGLTINSTNKWRQYEIPVVLGDADYGFEIQASGAVSGDVYIDEAFVKVEQVTQDVGQAHFVGSVSWGGSAGCNWTVPTTVFSAPSTNTSCSDGVIVGNLVSSDLKKPYFEIPNARTDGTYKIIAAGTMGLNFVGVSSNSYAGLFVDGTKVINKNRNQDSSFFENIIGDISFNTSGTKTVEMRFATSAGASNPVGIFNSTVDRPLKYSVYFYPDDSSTIVTQDTELTAKTANEFSWQGSSTAVVSKENYDVINGNGSVVSTGRFFYSFNSNIFTVAPNCTCSAGPLGGSTQDWTCSVNTVNSGGLTVNISNNGVATSTNHTIFCSKQGADVNKSQTIVGKFENINSTDLVKISYKQPNADAVPNATLTPIVYDSLIYDNSNGAYNTSTGVFTSPRDSYYKVCASAMLSSSTYSAGNIAYLYFTVTGGNLAVQRETVDAAVTRYVHLQGCRDVYLAKDATILTSIFQNKGSAGTMYNAIEYNTLTIDELPDYEAIVKNLSDQKTKCQTKVLSANVSTTGVMSDLTFNNLTIGKKYRITGKFDMTRSVTSATNKNIEIQILNGTESLFKSLDRNYGGTEWITNGYPNKYFTATDTIVTTTITATADMLIAGATDRTYLQLCELPDTYVETTKF